MFVITPVSDRICFQHQVRAHNSHVLAAFRAYDIDGDGYITAEELCRALREPIEVVREYIQDHDVDHDGKIDFKASAVVHLACCCVHSRSGLLSAEPS